jgi:hypothetical protein
LIDIKREIEGKKTPSNIVIMESLSERYGWLPSQIKGEGVDDILDYIDIIGVRSKLEKQKIKK